MEINRHSDDMHDEPRDTDPRGRSAAPTRLAVPTSAVTRDAARLRSMMVNAVGRPAPDALDAACENSTGDTPIEPAATPASTEGQHRPTTLRMPRTQGRSLRSLMADPSRRDGGGRIPEASPAVKAPAETETATASDVGAEASGTITAVRAETIESAAENAPTLDPATAQTFAASAQNGGGARRHDRDEARIATQPSYEHRSMPTADPARPASERSAYVRPATTRLRRAGRPVMATVAVLAGTAIGVGLYAGGGDLISDIFSRHEEMMTTDPNPSAVTERPIPVEQPTVAAQMSDSVVVSDVEHPTAGSQMTTGQAATSVADGRSTSGSPVVSPVAPVPHAVGRSTPPAAMRRTGGTVSGVVRPPNEGTRDAANDGSHAEFPAKPAQPSGSSNTEETGRANRSAQPDRISGGSGPARPIAAGRTAGAGSNGTAASGSSPAGAGTTSGRAVPRPAAGASTQAGGKGAGKFVVQVRATPDQAEANLVVKRLKSKGAKGVELVRTPQKDGTVMYRIRYSATGTAASAQEAATRAGYKKVWVVQKKQ